MCHKTFCSIRLICIRFDRHSNDLYRADDHFKSIILLRFVLNHFAPDHYKEDSSLDNWMNIPDRLSLPQRFLQLVKVPVRLGDEIFHSLERLKGDLPSRRHQVINTVSGIFQTMPEESNPISTPWLIVSLHLVKDWVPFSSAWNIGETHLIGLQVHPVWSDSLKARVTRAFCTVKFEILHMALPCNPFLTGSGFLERMIPKTMTNRYQLPCFVWIYMKRQQCHRAISLLGTVCPVQCGSALIVLKIFICCPCNFESSSKGMNWPQIQSPGVYWLCYFASVPVGNNDGNEHSRLFQILCCLSAFGPDFKRLRLIPTMMGQSFYLFCKKMSCKFFFDGSLTDSYSCWDNVRYHWQGCLSLALDRKKHWQLLEADLISHLINHQHASSDNRTILIRFCLFSGFGLLSDAFVSRLNFMPKFIIFSKIALRSDFKWYKGARIGEAQNPGPTDWKKHHPFFDCAFVNPTSLNGKLKNVCCLDKQLILFAETSATKAIQMQETAAARAEGYRTIFSPPVLPQRNGLDEETLRGQATGTAAYSQIPMRLSRTIDQSDWFSSGRLLQIFLELGSIEIQVLVIYGFQLNHPKSRARTDLLIQHAITLTGLTNHPTILVGDFNHPLDSLRSCDQLWQQGYRSAASIFSDQTGGMLPPTFKNQTSNDVAIFSPELVPLISDIYVDSQELFAGHHPLCFRVNLPTTPFTKNKWNLPQSWIGLLPDPNLVELAYEPLRSEEGEWNINIQAAPQSVLYAWSQKVEASVHQALKTQHERNPTDFPYNGLPRAYRGRCKPRKLVQAPLSKPSKTAWNGHYTPATDCGSIVLRQRTKQIRRIQSLKHRIKAFRPEIASQLWEEWNAILTSTGFTGGFVPWIQSFEIFQDFAPYLFPTVDRLYSIEQLLIHETDSQIAELHRIRRNKAAIHDNFDLRQQHKKESFKKIREPGPGILQQVEITKEIPIEHCHNEGWGLATLTLKKFHYIDSTLPATLNGQRVDIIELDN